MQSPAALETTHSALAHEYICQVTAAACVKPVEELVGLPCKLKNDPTYNLVYTSIMAKLTRQGERSTTVDPQRNTTKDAYNEDEYEQILGASMSKGTPEGDRAVAMAAWSHSSVGRSDDVRLFFMADLIAPQYIPAVGECHWPHSSAEYIVAPQLSLLLC